MSHRYKVGQMLELRSAPRHSNRPAGPCEVLTCMPNEKGPVLYRVKSWGESNERVVEEANLAPSAALKTVFQESESFFNIAISKR